ncbi:hypothetical protein H632_c219p0 [Helicosporidium sp. ATCC 50920]|nr:hypothetical protein H632_c219p0 [Helicosporidium sp. ATCC 50920]|eukprot:KDD76456.1 hypothetical protein H632_c219p0 [Helicosporidium sp. ATCC 50920]
MWRFKSATNVDTHGRPNPYLETLNEHVGRQTWVWEPSAGTTEERKNVDKMRAEYTKNRYAQKHCSDVLFRSQMYNRRVPASKVPEAQSEGDAAWPSAVTQSLKNGISYFEAIQCEDGHWAGDYGGPMFLMPGLLIAMSVMKRLDTDLTPMHKSEMVRYLRNHANPDGGWGLHIEGPSTMFGTALNYVAARLLGVSEDDPLAVQARAWMHPRGGAVAISSWGKFWLSVLGVYAWEGQNPLPPEMWLLPYSKWTGLGYLHPGRFWCHCRMVYLPMCYLYGRRVTGENTPLVQALRQELYPVPYDSVDWDKARNTVATEDLYYPHPLLQDVLWWTLSRAEPFLLGSRLRNKALQEVERLLDNEDRDTRYVDIGPVNKSLNWLCAWARDPEGPAVKKHAARLADYLWISESGMKMQGYNGSQLWDTSFFVQAVVESGLGPEFKRSLALAHSFVEATQVMEDPEPPLESSYRHISKGAWPFSTRDHGWPISDCSSEGLKASLALRRLGGALVGPALPDERLFDCVNVLLSFQNPSGGWATYEPTRSVAALELLNPAETFGDIVIDYDYVECTSACVTALHEFRQDHPAHRSEEVSGAIARGVKLVKRLQRRDGSWYGNWAVCFTYGTWFGLEALRVAGESAASSRAVRRACSFLVQRQRADGGWSETHESSSKWTYTAPAVASEPSHVVCTAWALMALLAAGYQDVDPASLHRAAACLLRQQLPDGNWPQQRISGVFNRNCMISYTNYRNIFPVWALGRYRKHVLGL